MSAGCGAGAILNVASTAAFQPMPGMAIYGATNEQGKMSAEGIALQVGAVVTIPIGLQHAVNNQGDEDILIFAFHSPATI